MITREHSAHGVESSAQYSACDRYRYALTRIWDAQSPRLMFVMLNPSTATEIQNDPTIARCEKRTLALGYGGFRVTNLFAWRATDPRDLRGAADPVGPQNDATISAGADWADTVLAAWGVHGAQDDRGPIVAQMLRDTGKPLLTLGCTMAGHPRHPLYVGYAQSPNPWPLG